MYLPSLNSLSICFRLFSLSWRDSVNCFKTAKLPSGAYTKEKGQKTKNPRLRGGISLPKNEVFTSVSSHQKRSVSYGLSCDGLPEPCGHWLFPCAYENREQFYDAYDEVGMYVSCSLFFHV